MDDLENGGSVPDKPSPAPRPKLFKFTGGDERVFLFPRAFTVKPGEIVEADECPDAHWFVPADQAEKE